MSPDGDLLTQDVNRKVKPGNIVINLRPLACQHHMNYANIIVQLCCYNNDKPNTITQHLTALSHPNFLPSS